MKMLSLKTAAAFAGLLLISGCVERVVYTRPPNYPPPPPPGSVPPPPDLSTNVTAAPPAAQAEVVPAQPGPDYVWIPGYWEWRGTWVWVSGAWVRPPHHHVVWMPGVWIQFGHGYRWHGGHWR